MHFFCKNKKFKKDFKLRNSFLIKEKKLKFLNYLTHNNNIKQKKKQNIKNIFINLNSKYFKTKIKNRCILSSRSRSIYKKFRLSRLKLKENINLGNIPGHFKL